MFNDIIFSSWEWEFMCNYIIVYDSGIVGVITSLYMPVLKQFRIPEIKDWYFRSGLGFSFQISPRKLFVV